MADHLTASDLLKKHPFGKRLPGEVYKFLKVNGEYRFCDLVLPHGSMLENHAEKAEAAGTFRLSWDYWTMTDWQSSSLGVRCGSIEVEDLTKLFGRPEERRF